MCHLIILVALLSLASGQTSDCYDQNVRFNGDSLTITNAKTAGSCSVECGRRSGECGAWTWDGARCELKKVARPGHKVTGSGHLVCPSTRKGVRWCATKVTRDNRVAGTSQQN